jgi:hypothetical protein
MGQATAILLLAAAMLLTLQRSAVWAFVTLYLPGVILLSATKQIGLPGIPDIDVLFGIMYGILGGIVIKGGETLNFRFGIADAVILAMSSSSIITSGLTENLWTSVNMFGLEFMGFLMPYFLARAAFHDPLARRRGMWILIGCMLGLSFFALIELRLWPFFLSRWLRPMGLFLGQNTMVMMRFHLFRTQLTFHHPIDTGNACLLIAAMIAVFAMTTSVGLKNRYVQLGLLAALGISATSLSFTAWFGAAAAIGMLAVLWFMPFIGRYLVIFWMVLLAGGIFMTLHLKNMPLGEREDVIGQSITDSTYIRAEIIQRCWPFASEAGWFGYGKTVGKSDLDLDSVDNSYMLFTLRRGFLYLGLILSLPLILCLRVSKVYRNYSNPQQRLPVAIALCALLGIMVAMFTVWFGFVYATLWVILLGMTHSMIDVLNLGPAPAPAAAARIGYRRPVVSRQLAGASGI